MVHVYVAGADVAVDDGAAMDVTSHPQELSPQGHHLLKGEAALFRDYRMERSKISYELPSGTVFEEHIEMLGSFSASM